VPPGAPQPITRADVERWKKEHSNWGRWGATDERGALNLITPAKQREAAALVRDGFSVSLAREADYGHNPDTDMGAAGTGPYERIMATPGLDWFILKYHGFAHTHFDALAHGSQDGHSYNGYVWDKDRVITQGHPKESIIVAKTGVLTRGILIDIPRLRGVPYLEPGDRVTPADLEAWEKQAGVKVSAGDALFVRTGRWARVAKVGRWQATRNVAGLDASVIPWLRQRDISILSGEAPQDANPAGGELRGLVVHEFALVYLGVHLIDNGDFEALSEAAAARKRWEFLFTVAPLPMGGGTGSPVNPIAIL
jgi:kynurenine formamidase